MRPTPEPKSRGWGSLGALAWLGICIAGLACWSRRMRGEWLPGLTRLREHAHDAPRIALLVGGLLVLNGVLLFFVLTEGQAVP